MSDREEHWSEETGRRLGAALDEFAGQEKKAADELLPLVYDELRRVAAVRMSRLPPGQTLQPTGLVHEAFLRLVGTAEPGWVGRTHFFAAAACAMRSVLVDRARASGSSKRGGSSRPLPLDDVEQPGSPVLHDSDVLELEDALLRLEEQDARKARVVVMRFYAGMSAEEIGRALGCSSRTVEREWRFARAWLHEALDGEGPRAPAR
jgi:RNA polymerase sigma factor (TIGR02999 family)